MLTAQALRHASAGLAAVAAAAVASALRSPLTTSAAAGAAAEGPAKVNVADLIDANCGPYGSAEQQGSSLQVLEPGFRWALRCGTAGELRH